jgi:hypothetical protein
MCDHSLDPYPVELPVCMKVRSVVTRDVMCCKTRVSVGSIIRCVLRFSCLLTHVRGYRTII